MAALLIETGRFDESAAVGEAGGSPRCLAVAGEARLARGMVAEAEALAKRAIEAEPSLFRARYLLGEIAIERGDRSAAREAFEWLFGAYAEQDVTDPEDLTLTAQASVRAAELSPAVEMDFAVTMKLLDTIVKEHDAYLPAWIARGDLYLAAYQDQDAKKSYEGAVKRNPRYPPALLGIAEQGAFRFDELSGVARCREALLTNPNFFAAKEFIARTRIGDAQHDEAKKLLAEVLAVNPRRKQALSLLAAIDFLTGDAAGFRAAREGDPRSRPDLGTCVRGTRGPARAAPSLRRGRGRRAEGDRDGPGGLPRVLDPRPEPRARRGREVRPARRSRRRGSSTPSPTTRGTRSGRTWPRYSGTSRSSPRHAAATS